VATDSLVCVAIPVPGVTQLYTTIDNVAEAPFAKTARCGPLGGASTGSLSVQANLSRTLATLDN